MVSRLLVLLLALVSAGSLQAQAPVPVRLSFADAVRQATGATNAPPPVVELAGLRTDESRARVTQARSGLLPSLSLAGSWANRDFNPKAQGLNFPGLPKIIGPFDAPHHGTFFVLKIGGRTVGRRGCARSWR